MSKTLLCAGIAKLLMIILCVRAEAQEFRWPREKAFEVGGGMSGSGYFVQGGYVRFFQPRKIKEMPFKGRYKSLIGRNKYVAFPCNKKSPLKIPPGVSAKLSFFYEQGSGKGVQYRIVGADASFLYLVFSRKNLYVSAKGGISISDNRLLTPLLNENNKLDYYERLKYGILGGVEIERMLGKLQSTSLIGGWQEYYLAADDSWGDTRWYAFIGLRFKITEKVNR